MGCRAVAIQTDVGDLAHAVACFASDAAEHMTCQTLHVSGGLCMP
jgi:hypothetical protein